MNPLARDIHDRLDRRLFDIAALIGPDVYDQNHRRIPATAERLAAQLIGPDPRVAAQTAIDLAGLVDLDDVEDVASPLGIAVALTFEYEAVSRAVAAQLLGCSRQRVHALVTEGKLTGPDDSTLVWRHSIARRLESLTGAIT